MSCSMFDCTLENPLTSRTNILLEQHDTTVESWGFMEDTVWQHILHVLGNVPWDMYHGAASSYPTHLTLHWNSTMWKWYSILVPLLETITTRSTPTWITYRENIVLTSPQNKAPSLILTVLPSPRLTLHQISPTPQIHRVSFRPSISSPSPPLISRPLLAHYGAERARATPPAI